MKRVMIIANSYKTLLNFRIELIQKLIYLKYDVIIIIPHNNNNILLSKYPIKILEVPLSRFSINPLKEFILLFRIFKIIRSYKPDKILTFTIKPNLYVGIIKSLFNQKFAFIPTITGLGKNFQNPFTTLFFLFLYKFAFLKAYKIFFQNRSNWQLFLSKKIVNQNNSLIVNGSGVNINYYPYSEPNFSSTKKFLMVSRLRKDKGLDEFFSIINEINLLYPNVIFGLIGWIEEKKYIKILHKYSKFKNFIYFGELSQKEVKNKIIEFDCIIHPSHHEGMSNVLLEAGALGRPAIASNIPGCNDIIINNVNGFLFILKDHKDLLSKVIKYINLDFKEENLMSVNSNRIIVEKFSREEVTNLYLNNI